MMADHVCSSFYKSENNKLAITAVVLIKSSLQPHARIVFVNPDVPAAPVFTGAPPQEGVAALALLQLHDSFLITPTSGAAERQ